MNQILTKRNVLIAGIIIVLLAVIVIAVVLQMKSTLPTIRFEYGELDERESEIQPTVAAIDWKRAPEEAAVNGEDVRNVGYATVMQDQMPCMQYAGKTIGFYFDTDPESVNLYLYDQEGNMIDYQPNLSEYVFDIPSEAGDFLYVLEGMWEQGVCGYAFWITSM